LSSTLARITLPAVGASTCAAGSHVWNGNIGTLIANEMKNAAKTQQLEAGRVVVAHHVGDAEAARLQAQRDQRDQQEDGARHRVDEELERGVDLPRSAPDADHERHRDQHRLPEEEEEDRIERAEHADHRRLHDQEADHEFLDARLDVASTRPARTAA
jgi:hypothetical protein